MLSLTCPHCLARLRLPARRLLVRADAGRSDSGELLFTCITCQDTIALDIDARGIAAAVAAGVSHLIISDVLVGDDS